MEFPPYTLVSSAQDLDQMIQAIAAAPRVGLDLETTGLNLRHDRIRLLSLATLDRCFILDLFARDATSLFALLFPAIQQKQILGHHLAFDLGFLAVRGFEAGAVLDTLLLDHLIHAGRPGLRHTLADVAHRQLGMDLPKELQRSDWTGDLSELQLEYADRDASVLLPLAHSLETSVQQGDLQAVADIECRCLPAIVWMSSTGVPVDEATWLEIAADLDREADDLRSKMDGAAPPLMTLDLGFGRNWDNASDLKRALKEIGFDGTGINDEALSQFPHPLARLLRRYRENRKLASTYGREWLKNVESGRAYPDWRQLGATSGRMACSNPNLQQIPRSRRYRECIAAPPGRRLIKADYSQIELRIAAKVAGEEAMFAAYRDGSDLHRLTAQRVLGKQEVSREDRQLAKAINFGLLYGMGAEGFQRYARAEYGVSLTLEQASTYRNGFFSAYPGLRSWHAANRDSRSPESRTLAGRRRFMDEGTPLPLRLNTPIQGTGADGLKLSLALLWERRHQCPGAVPVIACHDEIVVECPEDQLEAAAHWLRQAMIDGMAPLIHPIPVEVELTIGRSWAGADIPLEESVPAASKQEPIPRAVQLTLF